jgi:hypothetical protein
MNEPKAQKNSKLKLVDVDNLIKKIKDTSWVEKGLSSKMELLNDTLLAIDINNEKEKNTKLIKEAIAIASFNRDENQGSHSVNTNSMKHLIEAWNNSKNPQLKAVLADSLKPTDKIDEWTIKLSDFKVFIDQLNTEKVITENRQKLHEIKQLISHDIPTINDVINNKKARMNDKLKEIFQNLNNEPKEEEKKKKNTKLINDLIYIASVNRHQSQDLHSVDTDSMKSLIKASNDIPEIKKALALYIAHEGRIKPKHFEGLIKKFNTLRLIKNNDKGSSRT